MTLSDVSIKRPVFTAMLSLALLVVGILSFFRLPTDLYPPVNFPILLVRVVYPGASPQDIERDVTKPIEDAVAGIPGLQMMQSFSRDGFMIEIMKFEMDSSIDEATNTVRDRIGAVKGQLPSAADEPVIQQIDIGALPVMVVALSSPGGVNETRTLADKRLRPLLEQVAGVGSVDVNGGEDREIQVNLDLDKMRALQIPLDQLNQRIGIENVSVPVGDFTAHQYTVGIRAEGQFQSVEDLASTVVTMTRDGQQVHLRDIAEVVDGFTKPEMIVRYNGQNAVTLSILKRSGANTVAVSDGVQEKLKEAIPNLGAGVQYDIIADQSLDIRANTEEVWVAIYFGGAMAILVILFFLLDVRGTIISAMALPTSVIGTFALMAALGFSINMMTLMALSLAIGLLIDDAVVVRESITRRLEAGDPPMVAASRGTSEIALAVLATTLSLVAVFVPVAFMSGMVGQFFKQFGLTMAAAVMLSLFIAFTLDPMLSARLTRRHHGEHRGLARLISRFLDTIDVSYQRILNGVLRWPWMVTFTAVAIFVVTLGVAALLPTEMVPKPDRGEVQADLELPVGTALTTTDLAARRVEEKLAKIPGVYRVYTVIGQEHHLNRVRFRVKTVDKSYRPHSLNWYEDEVRAVLSEEPTAQATLMPPAVIEGVGDWPPMMVIIQGDDLNTLLAEGRRVKAMMEGIAGSSDVRISVNPGIPELHVDVDRARASDRGLPSGLVGITARSLVEGQLVGTMRDGGAEADIRVRAAPRFASNAEAIATLPLSSPRGTIALGDVATVTMGAGPSEIQHYNRMRAVTVSTQIANGYTLGTVQEQFLAALKAAPLPKGYFYTLDGQVSDMNETAKAMGLAVLVAALFIFMVLASQFESLFHPFTLMASLPLALVGAIFALALTGNTISMGSQIGLVLLMGLVTKNAILLVDGALSAMREGASPADAMRHAGPRRLRPILMTTAAMVLGMIPTALNHGVGAEFRAPMAIVVIGGVLSSTVLTLLVVPVAFVQMEQFRSFMVRIWERISPPDEEDRSATHPMTGSVMPDEEGAAK